MKFSFTGLIETWLDKDKEEFYYLQGYFCINRYRDNRRGGGVLLHIWEDIYYIRRNDLEYFDSELESIFTEIDENTFMTNSNIIIAVTYRMPDLSVEVFNERWLMCFTALLKQCFSPHNKANKSDKQVCDINTLRPRQSCRHFADDIFKCIFLNENVSISLQFSPTFVPKVWINNIPALVQIMAWCQPGDKPLSVPIMVNLLTHICITRPQWVNWSYLDQQFWCECSPCWRDFMQFYFRLLCCFSYWL